MKVKILDWHAVTFWHWDFATHGYSDDLCGICRAAFDGTCPNCKYPGDECPIVLGDECTHNFHLHCILKWLEQDDLKGLCPMCRQIFLAKEDVDDLQPRDPRYADLKRLIERHRATRERLANTSEQEYEVLEEMETS